MSGGALISWLTALNGAQVVTLAEPLPVQVTSTDPLGNVVQGANADGVAIVSGGLRIMTKGPTGLAADLLSNAQGDLRTQDVGRAYQVQENVNIPVGPSLVYSSTLTLGYASGTITPWNYYSAICVGKVATAVVVTPQYSFDNVTWNDAAAGVNVTPAAPTIFKIPALAGYFRISFFNNFAFNSTIPLGHGFLSA